MSNRAPAPPRPRRRRQTLLVLSAVGVGLAALQVAAHVRATAFVARAADTGGWVGALAARHAEPFREMDVVIPSRQGPVPARVYRPHSVRRTLVVPPGVHALGIDEPRMVRFARDLAAAGVAVVTPEIPDVKRYRMTPGSVDALEDATLWVLDQPELVDRAAPALAGTSFAGGLAIVAAGRPALRDRLSFVASLGGHGDLPRVIRYLCTGVQPDGTTRLPHDYGVAVILLNVAQRVVPSGQEKPLREGIRQFLHASHLAVFDEAAARLEFERARMAEAALPEPAATLLHLVNERDVERLGAILRPHVAGWGDEAALSPERSAAPAAPVFLLHGSDDNVIPAQESTFLARRLEGHTKVHVLVTPLITHAQLDETRRIGDVVRLVAFWAAVLE
jgi:dienelactone hydrolase